MAKSFRDLTDKTGNKKTEAIAKQRTEELLQQIDRLTLSDEEIEAISEAADSYDDGCNERCVKIAAILRNLLEKTKDG